MNYADRSRYLNYSEDADPENSLIQEAILHCPSRFLAPQLEMFDLPGPGAKGSLDQWTMEQYLPEMDGVMLFINCSKLGDDAVEKLYGNLRRIFRDLHQTASGLC